MDYIMEQEYQPPNVMSIITTAGLVLTLTGGSYSWRSVKSLSSSRHLVAVWLQLYKLSVKRFESYYSVFVQFSKLLHLAYNYPSCQLAGYTINGYSKLSSQLCSQLATSLRIQLASYIAIAKSKLANQIARLLQFTYSQLVIQLTNQLATVKLYQTN